MREILHQLINDLKNKELNVFDLNNPKSIVNHCSYFSCIIIAKLKKENIPCSNLNIAILGKYLPNDSYVKSQPMDSNYHNVVKVGTFIIDLSRKQFGSLIKDDIMTYEDYFKVQWNIKMEIDSKELNC